MNNLKTIITVFAISLSTVFSSIAAEKPNDTKDDLRSSIVSIIGSNIQFEVQENTTASISFIINNSNELVIISVDSELAELNSYLKGILNYKKIYAKGIKKGDIYRMPLKVNKVS